MSHVRPFLRGASPLLAVFRAVLAFSVFGASPALADYSINKDLYNLGPTASGVAIVVAGMPPVIGHYDGSPCGINFATFGTDPVGPNKRLRWQTPNQPIATGDLVHVGFTVPAPAAIKDMYFTDASGNRLPGSIVHQTAAHGFYDGMYFDVILDNFFAPVLDGQSRPLPLYISDVQVAVLPGPVDLADLNNDNMDLADLFEPLFDGRVILEPGDVLVLTLPDPPPPDGFVVLRYVVEGENGMARSVDFVGVGVWESGYGDDAEPGDADPGEKP
jgi:hypothetical protein